MYILYRYRQLVNLIVIHSYNNIMFRDKGQDTHTTYIACIYTANSLITVDIKEKHQPIRIPNRISLELIDFVIKYIQNDIQDKSMYEFMHDNTYSDGSLH